MHWAKYHPINLVQSLCRGLGHSQKQTWNQHLCKKSLPLCSDPLPTETRMIRKSFTVSDVQEHSQTAALECSIKISTLWWGANQQKLRNLTLTSLHMTETLVTKTWWQSYLCYTRNLRSSVFWTPKRCTTLLPHHALSSKPKPLQSPDENAGLRDTGDHHVMTLRPQTPHMQGSCCT